MKKILSNTIAILIIFLLSFSSISFAFENNNSEESKNAQIGEASTLEQEEQKEEEKVPQDKIIQDHEEKKENTQNSSGIATIAATPVSNFDYVELSDGTISITNYKGTLKNVEIPSKINGKTVTEIGGYAFYYNDYLESLTIPDTVKEIGSFAFYWCYKLTSINFGKGIETIGMNAFAGIRVRGTLTIPDSVKTIESQAFMECYELKSVKLGKNLSSIGINVFAESAGIESFTVNANNASFSEKDGVIFNKDKTKIVLYPPAKTGNTYNIPSTVKTIGATSFYGAENLTSIKIPDTVTKIEQGAFAKAINLSSITIGKNVTTIADYAFNYTPIENITIPAATTSLDPLAFMAASKLKNININASNKTYCSKSGVVFNKDSTKIIIYPQGKTDANYNIPSGVKTIGESAFINAQITSVSIPSSVTKFEDWCFAKTKLTSVTIPSSVKTYGNGPFDTCTNLKTVVDNSSANIPYRMFAECTNLSSVKLNDNIQEIGSRGFYKCTSLKTITLPKKLKRIEYGFLLCSNLSKVDIPEQVEYISESSFENNTQVNISKTKLTKLENGSYAIIYDVYLTGTFYYDKAKEVLNQLNQYRKEQGKSELKMDQDLFTAAMERAKETALYFDHTRPSGLSCYTACSKMNAENIAAGSSTASATMTQWKNSAGHNSNMLNSSWKSVGIGCYYTNGTYYWVQCFSADAGVEQTKIPANKTEKQKIQTLDDKIDIYYRDSKNISLAKGKNTTVGKIYTGNTGWDYPLILLEPESFKWTSSNSKIATVGSKGEIKAVDYGSTTIKASIGKKEIVFNVSVKLPFTDLKETDYYYGSVAYTYENKIIKGKSDTIFAPRANITRGELVTILYRMEGSPKIGNKNPFKDVKEGAFYYNGVIWASEKGIVSGYGNGKFGASDPIKRAQLATILYNYAKYKKVDLSKKTDITTYKDYNTVKNKTIYALDAFKWAIGSKIMNGTDEGNINPTAYATRGQAAVMITNYCKKMKK